MKIARSMALSLVALATCGAGSPEAGNAAYERGRSQFDQGDFAGAIETLAEAIAAYDAEHSVPDKRYYCANGQQELLVYAALGAGEHKDTIVTGPEWCGALFMQGYAYGELKQPGKAVEALRRAAALSPFHAQYETELGFELRKTGDIEGALDAYKRALSLSDKNSPVGEDRHWEAAALRGIGYVLIDKGDWDGAEKAYRQSLKLEPDSEVGKSELEFIRQNRPHG